MNHNFRQMHVRHVEEQRSDRPVQREAHGTSIVGHVTPYGRIYLDGDWLVDRRNDDEKVVGHTALFTFWQKESFREAIRLFRVLESYAIFDAIYELFVKNVAGGLVRNNEDGFVAASVDFVDSRLHCNTNNRTNISVGREH